MHLVIVTCELANMQHSSGGLASFTANLARIFRSNGHKVTIVLATTRKEENVFDEGISIRNIYLEKSLWDSFNYIAKIFSSIEMKKQDEIRKAIVNIYKSERVEQEIRSIDAVEKIDMIHVCSLCALSLGLDNRIPYVVRISSFTNICSGADLPNGHIDYEENDPTIKEELENRAMKRARYVISPSNLMAEIAQKYLGINPTVIESPFLLDTNNWDYSVYNSLMKEKKYIIHYGRLSYFKGTHVVAQIAKRLLEKHSDVMILLVGNYMEMMDDRGNEMHAYELVKNSAGKYAERVIYAGSLRREQLYPLVQNAELCLLPSRIENLPNACIEAMAMGKIVIGTRGASFEQLITDEVSGFLCERDNAGDFYEAVDKVLCMNRKERKQIEAEAVTYVGRLAPQVIYEKYLAFYEKVIREWDTNMVS